MTKLLVSGADGQLGKSFQKISFDWPAYEFCFCNKSKLDITSKESVFSAFSDFQPDYFINCAAYTAVDKAEVEREKAYSINAESLDYITAACKKYKTTLIHFSSDYVYHNGMQKAMTEEAETCPQSIYAQSKKMGEEVISQSGIDAIILRTSWVYSEFGHNFLKTMLRLGKERSMLNVVNDQIGAPTYAADLATAVLKIIRQHSKQQKPRFQLLNYSGEGRVSWFDFANYIFKIAQIEVEVHPIPTDDYPTPATRPNWSVLDMKKIKSLYGIAPKYWKESVRECLSLLG